MNQESYSESEKKLFSQLSKEAAPPPHIEENILKRLKAQGLVSGSRVMSWKHWAAAAAIAILSFLTGSYYQQYQASKDSINPQLGYMLLLHETEDFQPGDPMEMFQEYRSWMQSTYARGVKIQGQELDDEAEWVGIPGESSTFKPYRTTGYFVLEANSLQEAMEIARQNPHVKYGGKIEVKPFIVR